MFAKQRLNMLSNLPSTNMTEHRRWLSQHKKREVKEFESKLQWLSRLIGAQHSYELSQTQERRSYIKYADIDIHTLKEDGFPELLIENEQLVDKIFEDIEKELVTQASYFSFDKFIEVTCSFRVKSVEEKIERFFRLIDADGNGRLSFIEIQKLCQSAIGPAKQTKREEAYELKKRQVTKTIKGDDFYQKLAEYFANFIFECVEVSKDEEISMDKFKTVILGKKDGAELLEMFCGEANVKEGAGF